MHIRKYLVIGCTMVLFISPALAEPKGKNGESCNVSSSTDVSHKIGDKNYKCDKCVYSKCSTSGTQISNCQTVTHWSNCTEQASRVIPGTKLRVDKLVISKDKVAPAKRKVPRSPNVGAPAIKSAE